VATLEHSLDRGLPASIDAERAILGAVLLDNFAYNQAAESLSAEDFSLDSHRRIYLRMMELAESNNLIGSPARVLDHLAVLADAGVDHVCAIQFPHDSVAEMLEQMEWFARDVIAAFAR